MRRREALAVLAGAVLAPGCAAIARPSRLAGLDDHLAGLHARGIFQGAVVMGRSGVVEYARAFGWANVQQGAAFTVESPNDGGSIAKTFTAAAVHKLAAEGRIALDDPVRRHVPEYPHEATRVRHLLLHSAGLPDYDWFDRHIPPPATRSNADQVALLRAHGVPPAFEPGTRFAYDNAAYDVAALVVESASGVPYERYVRREFLEPLGLRTAFVRPARLADFPGVRTIGYRGVGAAAVPFDAFEGEAFHGGGNLYVSAMDLHRWASAFALGTHGLDPATVARGLESGRLSNGVRTNLTLLSWYADGARRYYTGHHNGFFNFCAWSSADRTTAAMVSNSGLAGTHAAALPRALLAFAQGRDPAEPAYPATTDLPAEAMGGAWEVDGVGRVSIRAEGRARYLRLPSGLELRMFRQGPGVYAVPGLDGWLRFDGDPSAPGVTWDAVFLRTRGRRAGA